MQYSDVQLKHICMHSRLAYALVLNPFKEMLEVATFDQGDAIHLVPRNKYVVWPGKKTRVEAGPGDKVQLAVGKHFWTVESGSETTIPQVRHFPENLGRHMNAGHA
jgi:hypothetical protein